MRQRKKAYYNRFGGVVPFNFWAAMKMGIQKGIELMAMMPSKLANMKEKIEQARAKVRTPEQAARLHAAEVRFEENLKKHADRIKKLESGGKIGQAILARIKERQAEYEHAQAQAPQGT